MSCKDSSCAIDPGSNSSSGDICTCRRPVVRDRLEINYGHIFRPHRWDHWRESDMESLDIDGLVQEKRNSIADALELRLSWTHPSILPLKCTAWPSWNNAHYVLSYHSLTSCPVAAVMYTSIQVQVVYLIILDLCILKQDQLMRLYFRNFSASSIINIYIIFIIYIIISVWSRVRPFVISYLCIRSWSASLRQMKRCTASEVYENRR